jgi:hypothetical protein
MISPIHSRKAITFLIAVYAGLLTLWLMSPDQRRVGLPSLILGVIAVGALILLRRREGVFPLFELGTMTILATAAYALIPTLGYLFSGLNWTILSDNRLLTLEVSPAQMGHFTWWNVGYLLSFAAVYLRHRGRFSAQGVPVVEKDPLSAVSLVVLALGILVYLTLLYVITGASYWHSYEDLAATYAVFQNIPLMVQQVSSHLFIMLTLFKLALIILLIQHWRQRRWRYLLVLWLGAEFSIILIRMGARSEFLFLLLGAVLAYHRLIKPLKISTMMLLGGVLLLGVLVYGVFRIFVMAQVAIPITLDRSIFSMGNEFQILFGTAADLYDMKVKGLLGSIPWSLYFSDFLTFIPQQLLPFAKVDPSEWYLEQIGQKGLGVGFTFGVMSQGVIGGGWLELVLRGAILGYVFAAIHRWYVRHAKNLWVTLFYLFMCLFSYYTYRVSSFYFLSLIVHWVIPCVLLAKLGRILLSSRRKAVMTETI